MLRELLILSTFLKCLEAIGGPLSLRPPVIGYSSSSADIAQSVLLDIPEASLGHSRDGKSTSDDSSRVKNFIAQKSTGGSNSQTFSGSTPLSEAVRQRIAENMSSMWRPVQTKILPASQRDGNSDYISPPSVVSSDRNKNILSSLAGLNPEMSLKEAITQLLRHQELDDFFPPEWQHRYNTQHKVGKAEVKSTNSKANAKPSPPGSVLHQPTLIPVHSLTTPPASLLTETTIPKTVQSQPKAKSQIGKSPNTSYRNGRPAISLTTTASPAPAFFDVFSTKVPNPDSPHDQESLQTYVFPPSVHDMTSTYFSPDKKETLKPLPTANKTPFDRKYFSLVEKDTLISPSVNKTHFDSKYFSPEKKDTEKSLPTADKSPFDSKYFSPEERDTVTVKTIKDRSNATRAFTSFFREPEIITSNPVRISAGLQSQQILDSVNTIYENSWKRLEAEQESQPVHPVVSPDDHSEGSNSPSVYDHNYYKISYGSAVPGRDTAELEPPVIIGVPQSRRDSEVHVRYTLPVRDHGTWGPEHRSEEAVPGNPIHQNRRERQNLVLETSSALDQEPEEIPDHFRPSIPVPETETVHEAEPHSSTFISFPHTQPYPLVRGTEHYPAASSSVNSLHSLIHSGRLPQVLRRGDLAHLVRQRPNKKTKKQQNSLWHSLGIDRIDDSFVSGADGIGEITAISSLALIAAFGAYLLTWATGDTSGRGSLDGDGSVDGAHRGLLALLQGLTEGEEDMIDLKKEYLHGGTNPPSDGVDPELRSNVSLANSSRNDSQGEIDPSSVGVNPKLRSSVSLSNSLRNYLHGGTSSPSEVINPELKSNLSLDDSLTNDLHNETNSPSDEIEPEIGSTVFPVNSSRNDLQSEISPPTDGVNLDLKSTVPLVNSSRNESTIKSVNDENDRTTRFMKQTTLMSSSSFPTKERTLSTPELLSFTKSSLPSSPPPPPPTNKQTSSSSALSTHKISTTTTTMTTRKPEVKSVTPPGLLTAKTFMEMMQRASLPEFLVSSDPKSPPVVVRNNFVKGSPFVDASLLVRRQDFSKGSVGYTTASFVTPSPQTSPSTYVPLFTRRPDTRTSPARPQILQRTSKPVTYQTPSMVTVDPVRLRVNPTLREKHHYTASTTSKPLSASSEPKTPDKYPLTRTRKVFINNKVHIEVIPITEDQTGRSKPFIRHTAIVNNIPMMQLQ